MSTAGIDVAAARADTPGCAHVAHLNNAGASLPTRQVLDTVVDHLRLESERGGYEAAAMADDRVEATYDSVAALVGCDRDEVAIVDSATRAWDAVFTAMRFEPGDRVITSRVEYGSNVLAMLQAARTSGLEIEVAPSTATGEVDVEALAARLDDRVRLVAITHVPTESGLVNPAAAIGEVTRAAGVPYLLDACQSVGQMPLAMDDLGCDALTATGRKFLRAPRGTGFLAIRRSFLAQLDPPAPDLRAADWVAARELRLRPDARRFELFERSVAGVLGLGVAVDQARTLGLDRIETAVRALATSLRERLAAVRGVTLRDEGNDRCAIVTFTVDGHEPTAVRDALAADGVNVNVVVAGSARLDLDPRGIPAVVRASVHYYNDAGDLDRAVEGIEHLART